MKLDFRFAACQLDSNRLNVMPTTQKKLAHRAQNLLVLFGASQATKVRKFKLSASCQLGPTSISYFLLHIFLDYSYLLRWLAGKVVGEWEKEQKFAARLFEEAKNRKVSEMVASEPKKHEQQQH